MLNYDKQRAAKRRKKLRQDIANGIPAALEKAEKIKKTKHLYYIKSKAKGKFRTWKAAERSRKRFELIKTKIESEDINSRCMDFKRSKITPLAAAIRYCDLPAVRHILELKASPTLRCSSTQICTPLYDATWLGKPKIAKLLLEKITFRKGGATFGALHGAIHNRLFSTVKIMIKMGSDVNECYLEQTPLGAALTCGKNKSGDVRIVRSLLLAKADVMKKTKMCYHPYFRGSKTSHIELARNYSNERCRTLLNTESNPSRSNPM